MKMQPVRERWADIMDFESVPMFDDAPAQAGEPTPDGAVDTPETPPPQAYQAPAGAVDIPETPPPQAYQAPAGLEAVQKTSGVFRLRNAKLARSVTGKSPDTAQDIVSRIPADVVTGHGSRVSQLPGLAVRLIVRDGASTDRCVSAVCCIDGQTLAGSLLKDAAKFVRMPRNVSDLMRRGTYELFVIEEVYGHELHVADLDTRLQSLHGHASISGELSLVAAPAEGEDAFEIPSRPLCPPMPAQASNEGPIDLGGPTNSPKGSRSRRLRARRLRRRIADAAREIALSDAPANVEDKPFQESLLWEFQGRIPTLQVSSGSQDGISESSKEAPDDISTAVASMVSMADLATYEEAPDDISTAAASMVSMADLATYEDSAANVFSMAAKNQDSAADEISVAVNYQDGAADTISTAASSMAADFYSYQEPLCRIDVDASGLGTFERWQWVETKEIFVGPGMGLRMVFFPQGGASDRPGTFSVGFVARMPQGTEMRIRVAVDDDVRQVSARRVAKGCVWCRSLGAIRQDYGRVSLEILEVRGAGGLSPARVGGNIAASFRPRA